MDAHSLPSKVDFPWDHHLPPEKGMFHASVGQWVSITGAANRLIPQDGRSIRCLDSADRSESDQL
jgi:hypothetical protein